MANQIIGVDSTGYVTLYAPVICKKAIIREDCDSTHPPSQDLLVQCPPGTQAVRVNKGDPCLLTPESVTSHPSGFYSVNPNRPFYEGEPMAAVKTAAGAISLQVVPTN